MRPMGGRGTAGFGLIELMVGIAVMAIATVLALPAFSNWMRSAHLRATAEALQSGLQFARAEAARRNDYIRVELTTSADSGCATSTSATAWVVHKAYNAAGAGVSLSGRCNAALSDTVDPFLLRISPVVSQRSSITLTGSRSSLAFDGLGRLADLSDLAVTSELMWVNLKPASGTCVVDGGEVQCLRVVITKSGQVSLCDPAHTSSTDLLHCPEATS